MKFGLMRDERQLIYKLLKKIPKEERIRFLNWCCKLCSTPQFTQRIIETDGTAADIFWGVMTLKVQFNLDLGKVGTKLEEVVRRYH